MQTHTHTHKDPIENLLSINNKSKGKIRKNKGAMMVMHHKAIARRRKRRFLFGRS